MTRRPMASARGRSSPARDAVILSALAGGLLCLYAVVRGRRAESRGISGPRDDAANAAALDAAALQRAKEAAEAANDAKTRYLVSISHEIRSPLNAIYGYAQLLERGGAQCEEAGTVIRRSAEHLTNLVESMLEISRIESGVITLRSDVVDIRALLEQVVDMFRVQSAAKGLSLDLKVSDRLPVRVKTDEKRLRQILINLVSNAVKYTPTGGVTVTVGYRSQVADVAVSDTGIGIAADELDRVFDPFERGRSPEAQLQPGIGLGLAITRVLARVMGGDIIATSTPGGGSTFRLKLMLSALAESANPRSRRSRIEGYRGDTRTVLVVDDDSAQVAMLRSLLRPLGFVVHTAGDGAQAVALAAHGPVELVLLDIQMRGMSGWETAARLRAVHGDAIKIIMVSANVQEFRTGYDAPGRPDAFLPKPIDVDALLMLIGGQLGLRWTTAQAPAERGPDTIAPASLPADAAPLIERLRHATSIGHVRGIEAGLGGLRDAFPVAEGLVTVLERHLRDFDLRSLRETLDDAAR